MRFAQALIVDPAFLGDAVFDAAFAQVLVESGLAEAVDLVVRPPHEALASSMRWVRRVWAFDKRGKDGGVSGAWRMARRLRSTGYDVAFVPHPSVRSFVVARAAGISDVRWGVRTDLGFMGRRLALIDQVGEPSLQGCLRPDPGPAKSDDTKVVGLVPGSAWATKRWPIDRCGQWIALARDQGFQIRLLGSPSESKLAEELMNEAGEIGIDNRVGQPLGALVDSIAGLTALIAGDTGPLHIARALGVPTVALFGPTDSALHAFGAHDAVLCRPLPCRPCSAHGQAECPLQHHRCMTDIRAQEVQSGLLRVIST